MDSASARAVWARLIASRPLSDLGLAMIDGRIDLRGLVAPEPSTVRELEKIKTDSKVGYNYTFGGAIFDDSLQVVANGTGGAASIVYEKTNTSGQSLCSNAWARRSVCRT